ncbi:Metalloprotease TIKI1 [Seminavis robusta]|uniref:Metalloprotease TIKI1 n=1 Tax=Seminavis robusta TaxID=568900 RepID=A0A9N8HRN2_9STRA|nr:Metalloprotease TIKI1 [Seminavis robusta]|eukprot:Sro1290_g259850.1 Metalloprotease TIKI1 (438) ;mRNA; f:26966-28382
MRIPLSFVIAANAGLAVLCGVSSVNANQDNIITSRPLSLTNLWRFKTNHGILEKSFSRRAGRDQFRQLQSSEECTQDPFLWSIYQTSNSNSEEHVGFAVGTMHVPWDVVLTEEAWATIEAAIQGSCAVYAELNLEDPELEADLLACVSQSEASAARLADIPDQALQQQISNTLVEIAQDIAPDSTDIQGVIFNTFQSLSGFNLIQIIQIYNTPEYWPLFRQTLLTGEVVPAMDASILAEARPAGGLEDVALQCELLDSFNPSKDDLVNNYTDVWGPYLEAGLNESLSELIQAYRCGDVATFSDPKLFEGTSEESQTLLLDDRNIEMTEQMVDILETSTTKTVFAVGLAHWTLGDNSLENLLGANGYRLERVKSGTLKDLEALPNTACPGAEEVTVEEGGEEEEDVLPEPVAVSSVSRRTCSWCAEASALVFLLVLFY